MPVAPEPGHNHTSLVAAGRRARVDADDTAGVIAACAGADLLWLESPTNPLLQVAMELEKLPFLYYPY